MGWGGCVCPGAGSPVFPFFLYQLMWGHALSLSLSLWLHWAQGFPHTAQATEPPHTGIPPHQTSSCVPYLQHTLLGSGHSVQTQPPHLTLILSLFTVRNSSAHTSPVVPSDFKTRSVQKSLRKMEMFIHYWRSHQRTDDRGHHYHVASER